MGKIASIFGGPKIPDPPPPPPPPPPPAEMPDPESVVAQARKRRQAAARRTSGRASTIMSDALGVGTGGTLAG